MTTNDAMASALFEVAEAQGQLDTVEEELFRVARTLEASDGLAWTLADQSIPAEVRQSTLRDLLTGKVSPITVELAAFVVGEGRARDLPDIIDRVVAKVAERRDRSIAEVRVAEPLDDDRLARIRDGLTARLGHEVVVRTVIDPGVVGGVVVRIGDTIIDGTVGHRLEQLRRTMRATHA